MTPNDKKQYCSICNGLVKNTFVSGVDTCENCGTNACKTYEGEVAPHAPSPPNPNKGVNPTFIPRATPVNASYNAKKKARAESVKGWAKYYYNKEARRKNLSKEEKDDIYQLEFDNCSGASGIDLERKKRLNVDEQKGEVMQSCLDLEIDG